MYSFSFLRKWSMQFYSATITCTIVASLTPKGLLIPKRYKFRNKIHVNAILWNFEPVLLRIYLSLVVTFSLKFQKFWQKYSGLSWMVKRYYIQNYPENVRDNTETRNNSLRFNQVVNREQSNQARKKRTYGEGRWLFASC